MGSQVSALAASTQSPGARVVGAGGRMLVHALRHLHEYYISKVLQACLHAVVALKRSFTNILATGLRPLTHVHTRTRHPRHSAQPCGVDVWRASPLASTSPAPCHTEQHSSHACSHTHATLPPALDLHMLRQASRINSSTDYGESAFSIALPRPRKASGNTKPQEIQEKGLCKTLTMAAPSAWWLNRTLFSP